MPPRPRPSRLGLAALALVAAAAGFLLAVLAPPDLSHPRPVAFYVESGEPVGRVARTLEELGLVRNRRAFRILAELRGDAARVQAGPYRASTGDWPWEILDRMVRGATDDTTITVIEGLWLTEVADVMAPFLIGGRDSFLVAAADSSWDEVLGFSTPSLEGFLFPSTYRIARRGPARRVIRAMAGEFRKVWEDGPAARADSLGIPPLEVVTLASIVEAEAARADERPHIAAVYRNRLEAGQPLQADPTVVYGLGRRRARLLLGDLESDSPYNTYRVAGLPPGPIGNPGRDAIRAVLWPDEDCRDFYFVARGDGSHLFGRTFAEHQENRRRVERERRAARTRPSSTAPRDQNP